MSTTFGSGTPDLRLCPRPSLLHRRGTTRCDAIDRHQDVGLGSLAGRNDSQRDGLAADVAITVEKGAGRRQIDRATEQSAERLLQVDKVEKRTVRLEVDQEVDVAARGGIPTGYGTEHRDGTALVLMRERDNLRPVPLDQRAKGVEVRTTILILRCETTTAQRRPA